MRYSVYDYDDRMWRYFEAQGNPQPAAGWFRSGLGSTPESLVESLPADAIEVGNGNVPQGVIAASRVEEDAALERRSLAGLGELGTPATALQWVGLAILLGGAFYLGRRSVEAERKVRSAVAAARGAL